MATIYDVARRAGVSTYTVSVVLNRSAKVSDELTQRVLRAAEELDYRINRIASSLQTRRTQTVGMLIPDIANPWYARVVRGVEDVLTANHYSLFLGSTRDEAAVQARYLDVFDARQVDGTLIFLAPDSEEDLARLSRKRAPVVFVGRRPKKLEGDTATADNRLGAGLATAHLLGKGHRRIALITGPQSLTVFQDRVKGWRAAFRKNGAAAKSEYNREADGTQAGGYRETMALLELDEPPTAYLAGNLMMMMGVLKALKEKRVRVPKEAEVMSSDDSEWLDAFSPPISVVEQPSYALGVEAAQLLLRRLQAPKRAFEHVVLRPALKIR
jgi:LacI family transcriptional regulator